MVLPSLLHIRRKLLCFRYFLLRCSHLCLPLLAQYLQRLNVRLLNPVGKVEAADIHVLCVWMLGIRLRVLLLLDPNGLLRVLVCASLPESHLAQCTDQVSYLTHTLNSAPHSTQINEICLRILILGIKNGRTTSSLQSSLRAS